MVSPAVLEKIEAEIKTGQMNQGYSKAQWEERENFLRTNPDVRHAVGVSYTQGGRVYTAIGERIRAQKAQASSSSSRERSIQDIIKGAQGTYDASTKTYTSPEGIKQSMSIEEAKKVGAVVDFGFSGNTDLSRFSTSDQKLQEETMEIEDLEPKQSTIPLSQSKELLTTSQVIGNTKELPMFLQPQYSSKAQRELFEEKIIPYEKERKIQLTKEIQRYEDLGYKSSEAKLLAEESVSRGGVSFSMEEAEKITGSSFSKKVTPIEITGQTILGGLSKSADFIKPIFDVPLSKTSINGLTTKNIFEPFISKGYIYPTISSTGDLGYGIYEKELTIGKTLTLPSKVVSFTAKASSLGWADIYSKTIMKLPSEFQPEFGTAFKRSGQKIRASDIQKGVETTIGVGAFFIPGAATPLLVSEVAVGLEEYYSPQTEIEFSKAYQKSISEAPKLEEGQRYLTEEEAYKQFGKEFEGQLKNRGLVKAGLAGGVLVTGGLLKAYRASSQEIIKTEKLRNIYSPEFKELSFDIIVGGKKYQSGIYEITGEVAPPLKIIKTTKAREFLGIKPIETELVSSRKFQVFTPTIAFQEKPFFVAERIQGRKFTTMKLISGEGDILSLEDLGKLPNIEKFGVERLAQLKLLESPSFVIGDIGKLSSNQISSILKGEENILSKSNIMEQRLLRVSFPKKDLTRYSIPYKPGTSTRRVLATSEVQPFAETELFEIFTSRTIFKDVTKPFAKPLGRTPVLKGEILKIKEPFILDSGESFGMLEPSQIKKTPLSKTFSNQIQGQIQKQIMKPLPSSLPKPIKIQTGIKQVSQESYLYGIPRSVGGLGVVSSKYYGTGEYEFTNQIGVIPLQSKQQTISKTYEKLSLEQIQKPSLKMDEKLLQKFQLKQESKILQKSLIKEETKLIQEPMLKQQQKLMQKQLLKQQEKIGLDMMPHSQIFPPKTPPKTPLRPLFPLFQFGDTKKKLGKIKEPSRPFAYQPSLAALALGIKATEIPEFTITGLVLRPQIKKKRKRRNK